MRAQRAQEAQSPGADSVVALDNQAIAALPPLDAIADTVGGDTLGKLIPQLKKSGPIASVVGKPESAARAGFDVNVVVAQPDAGRLHTLAEAYRDGRLKIPIAQRMPLSQIREAHQLAEKGVSGQIALLVD